MKLTGPAPLLAETTLIPGRPATETDPGAPPFVVTHRHVYRAVRQRILSAATTTTFKPLEGREIEEVDLAQLRDKMLRHQIAGWSGLTVEHLGRLAPLAEGEVLDLPDSWDRNDLPCDHDTVVFTDTEGIIQGGKAGDQYTLPGYLSERAEPDEYGNVLERVNKAMGARLELSSASDSAP